MSNAKDLRNVAISTIARFSQQIVQIGTTFLLTPLMINTLGDYKYGIWVLVNIIVNYYGYTELGITSAIQRNLAVAIGAKNKDDFNKIFANGLFLNCIICVLVMIICLASVGVMHIIHFKEYKLVSALVFIMGMNLALTFPFRTFASIMSANIRFDILSGLAAFQLITNSIITAYLLLHGFGLVWLCLSSFVTTVLSNSACIFFARKIADFKIKLNLVNRQTIKKLLSYSGKSFMVQLSDILRFKLDEIVTGTFISVSMVTVYSVANKLNTNANNFCLSFLGVLNPFFSKRVHINNNEERIKMFFFISKIVMTMSFFVFSGFLLAGRPFIKIWLGENYLPAYLPLIILASGYFIAYIQSAGVNYMFSTNTHQYFAYISIFEGVVNFIASVVFAIVFKMGIIGVALGTLVPLSVTKLVVQPLVMSKLLQIKPFEYYSFFIRNILIGLALYAIAGLVVLNLHIISYLQIFLVAGSLFVIALFHLYFMLNIAERTMLKEKVFFRFYQQKTEAESYD